MSKECPNCHEEVSIVLQCNNDDCNMMYCKHCGDRAIAWTVILPEGIIACPSCGTDGRIVSSDD